MARSGEVLAPYGFDYTVACAEEGHINPGESVAQARQKLAANGKNTESFYRERIFNEQDSLGVKVVPSMKGEVKKGEIGINAAAWGWGELDLLLVAAGEGSLEPIDDAGHVATETIAMLDPQLRRDVLERTIAILIAAKQHFPDREFTSYENNSPYVRGETVTDGDVVFTANPSKTLSKVHKRVTSINKKLFTPSEKPWKFDHLIEEEARVKKYLPRYFRRGKANMAPLLDAYGIEMNLDDNKLMYEIAFPWTSEDILDPENLNVVNAVINAHDHNYHLLMQQGVDRYSPAARNGLLRDTWRLKCGFKDTIGEEGQVVNGKFYIQYRPQPSSGAGPIEVFENANLVRKAGLPLEYPVETLKEVWAPVVDQADALIAAAKERARPGEPNRILELAPRMLRLRHRAPALVNIYQAA